MIFIILVSALALYVVGCFIALQALLYWIHVVRKSSPEDIFDLYYHSLKSWYVVYIFIKSKRQLKKNNI